MHTWTHTHIHTHTHMHKHTYTHTYTHTHTHYSNFSALSYDGGIGMGPVTEGHGGSTYTGVAALVLLGCVCEFCVF
jgi:prenyltransferase beta subunit